MGKKFGTLTWKNRRLYKPSFWLSSVVKKSLMRKCSGNLLSSHSQIGSFDGIGGNKWSVWNQRGVLNRLLYREPLRIRYRKRHQMGWKETVTEVAVSSVEGVRGSSRRRSIIRSGNCFSETRQHLCESRLLDCVFIDTIYDLRKTFQTFVKMWVSGRVHLTRVITNQRHQWVFWGSSVERTQVIFRNSSLDFVYKRFTFKIILNRENFFEKMLSLS